MENKKKGNIILVIVLIFVIGFAIYAYIRFDNKNKQEAQANLIPVEEQIATDIKNGAITCYGYGGVQKIGFLNYEDAINKVIEFYNDSDGESMASMMDFAGNAVYEHKGLDNFDENLYKLVTDAENYKDEYYNDSLIIMSTMLKKQEEAYIEALDKYKVKMKLEELSELKQVEGSQFLYETTAKIKIDDKTEKKEFNSNTKFTLISYDGGKSFYILRMDEIPEEDNSNDKNDEDKKESSEESEDENKQEEKNEDKK